MMNVFQSLSDWEKGKYGHGLVYVGILGFLSVVGYVTVVIYTLHVHICIHLSKHFITKLQLSDTKLVDIPNVSVFYPLLHPHFVLSNLTMSQINNWNEIEICIDSLIDIVTTGCLMWQALYRSNIFQIYRLCTFSVEFYSLQQVKSHLKNKTKNV